MATTAALIDWLYHSGVRGIDGLPVASGAARFYVPGSAKGSSVVVYSDAAGLVPLTQPVALDAAGRAEVYIKQQAEIEVRDAGGSIVRDSSVGNRVRAEHVEVVWEAANSNLATVLGTIQTFIDNASASAPALSGNYRTDSTATPSFQFDPTKVANVFQATYGAAVGTLAITWPPANPGIAANTLYVLSIQTAAATPVTTVTFDSHIHNISGAPTSLLANTVYYALFLSPPLDSIAGITQITSWIHS